MKTYTEEKGGWEGEGGGERGKRKLIHDCITKLRENKTLILQ